MNYYDSGDDGGATDGGIPLILLGGAAQVADTWKLHYNGFKRAGRRIFIPELRCQGRSTNLLSKYASVEQQISDLNFFVEYVAKTTNQDQFDFVGFSFGGRIAMTYSAFYPKKVNKLSITGVALNRGPVGEMIIQSWKESVAQQDMRAAAFSFIRNGYSASFIDKYAENLKNHVDVIVESNNPTHLHDLFVHSHRSDKNQDQWSISKSASQIENKRLQIVAGLEDRIASVHGSQDLVDLLREKGKGNEVRYETFESGHLVPFEVPQAWRKSILEFLES